VVREEDKSGAAEEEAGAEDRGVAPPFCCAGKRDGGCGMLPAAACARVGRDMLASALLTREKQVRGGWTRDRGGGGG
jgi:hypothetical protein